MVGSFGKRLANYNLQVAELTGKFYLIDLFSRYVCKKIQKFTINNSSKISPLLSKLLVQ